MAASGADLVWAQAAPPLIKRVRFEKGAWTKPEVVYRGKQLPLRSAGLTVRGQRVVWTRGSSLFIDGQEAKQPGPARFPTMGAKPYWVRGSAIEATGEPRLPSSPFARPAMVAVPGGWLLLYRDASMLVHAKRLGGATVPVSKARWAPKGTPMHGVAAASSGKIVVAAWYADRGLHAAWSRDGGRSFEAPSRVGPGGLGRPQLVMDGADAILGWLAPGEGDALAWTLRRLTPKGPKGPAHEAVLIARGRDAGTPGLARVPAGLLLTWLAPGGEPGLRAALVDPARVGAGEALEPIKPEPWPGAEGQPIPDLKARGISGVTTPSVELRSLKGPMLLNLWASWCMPCVAELPHLKALHAAHPELKVVGLSVDSGPQVAGRAAQRFGLPYPVLHADSRVVSEAFGTIHLPATFLYDAQGYLVWSTLDVIEEGDPRVAAALSQVLP